jgi:hypothetical protein
MHCKPYHGGYYDLAFIPAQVSHVREARGREAQTQVSGHVMDICVQACHGHRYLGTCRTQQKAQRHTKCKEIYKRLGLQDIELFVVIAQYTTLSLEYHHPASLGNKEILKCLLLIVLFVLSLDLVT